VRTERENSNKDIYSNPFAMGGFALESREPLEILNDMTKILICSRIEKSNIGVPTVYLKNQNDFPIFLDTHMHFYLGVFRIN